MWALLRKPMGMSAFMGCAMWSPVQDCLTHTVVLRLHPLLILMQVVLGTLRNTEAGSHNSTRR